MNPKVFHLVYSLIRGGTEGQCARVAMMFDGHGVGVSQLEGYFLPAVERACGPVYQMQIGRMFSPRTITEIFKLKRHLKAGKFEVLHAWDADAAIFGSVAARLAGIPYITSRRDLGEIYARRKLRLMQRADAGAAAVVVNATVIADRLIADGLDAGKIGLVPNVIDFDEFDSLARARFSQESRLPSRRWVGMVCRLDPEKDAELFIQAASEISARFPDVNFVLAGDGSCRAALEDMVSALHLQDRIVFLGDVKDVPALLVRLSIGVLVPKSNEGLSNSILEYMAAGLPVIATDCGGNAQLVREGETGLIIPVGDTRRLSDAIIQLLRDPDGARKMGTQGRRFAEQIHHPGVIRSQFDAIYGRVSGAKSRQPGYPKKP